MVLRKGGALQEIALDVLQPVQPALLRLPQDPALDSGEEGPHLEMPASRREALGEGTAIRGHHHGDLPHLEGSGGQIADPIVRFLRGKRVLGEDMGMGNGVRITVQLVAIKHNPHLDADGTTESLESFLQGPPSRSTFATKLETFQVGKGEDRVVAVEDPTEALGVGLLGRGRAALGSGRTLSGAARHGGSLGKAGDVLKSNRKEESLSTLLHLTDCRLEGLSVRLSRSGARTAPVGAESVALLPG
jgi:hypothetical protein